MGYYDYQQGLIYRHLNQGDGWNSHLAKCRDFILRAADNLNPRIITILGSGWLLELPISELAGKAEKIYLVDIVHPPQVIAQTAGLKNVQLVEEDLSGGLIEEVWEKAGKHRIICRLKSLDEIRIPGYQFYRDPGLVISLNILTQIEVLPERFLRKHAWAGEEEYMRFKKEVQKKHICSLSKYRTILITDTSQIFTDKKGNVTEKQTLLTELPEGSYSESWIWDFDLKRQDYNLRKSVLSVTAKII